MTTPMNTPMEMPIITPVDSWEPLDGEDVVGGGGGADTGIVVPFPAINLLTTCSATTTSVTENNLNDNILHKMEVRIRLDVTDCM